MQKKILQRGVRDGGDEQQNARLQFRPIRVRQRCVGGVIPLSPSPSPSFSPLSLSNTTLFLLEAAVFGHQLQKQNASVFTTVLKSLLLLFRSSHF